MIFQSYDNSKFQKKNLLSNSSKGEMEFSLYFWLKACKGEGSEEIIEEKSFITVDEYIICDTKMRND